MNSNKKCIICGHLIRTDGHNAWCSNNEIIYTQRYHLFFNINKNYLIRRCLYTNYNISFVFFDLNDRKLLAFLGHAIDEKRLYLDINSPLLMAPEEEFIKNISKYMSIL